MRGIDQAALAERVGVSRSRMSRILTGVQEPKLVLAHRLASELGVTLDFLLDEGQQVEPSGRLVTLTEEEWTILKIVRRLGEDVAIDRLLGVESPGQPDPKRPSNSSPESHRRG